MKSRAPRTIEAAKRATLASLGICAVTTVHHVYGAYLYNTPWRLHAALISTLATALIAVPAVASKTRKQQNRRSRVLYVRDGHIPGPVPRLRSVRGRL